MIRAQSKSRKLPKAGHTRGVEPLLGGSESSGPLGRGIIVFARGSKIFFSDDAGCATCHVGGRYSDGRMHDVGSRAKADVSPEIDTPSLVGIEQTAPYFHDGRYGTLTQLVLESDGAMGHTSHLSPADVRALIAYLETL